MNRRKYLAAAASVGTATLAGCETVNDFLNSSGFERVEWINLDVLRIHFKEDHDMNGFAIMHAFDDDPTDDGIVTQEAPPYSGPRDVRLVDRIRNGGRVYPSREFKLVGYKGSFGTVSVIGEKTGEFGFSIPESIMPRSKWQQSE